MVLASVCATPDGRPTYITGGNDNTIALWDIRDADDTMSHTTPTAEGKYVFVIALITPLTVYSTSTRVSAPIHSLSNCIL